MEWVEPFGAETVNDNGERFISSMLTEVSMKRLEELKMWLYRRILRISWHNSVMNNEVLRRLNKIIDIPQNEQYLGFVTGNAA